MSERQLEMWSDGSLWFDGQEVGRIFVERLPASLVTMMRIERNITPHDGCITPEFYRRQEQLKKVGWPQNVPEWLT